MSYIEQLYLIQKVSYDLILQREASGFYLINGYNFKYADINHLERITFMIDKWNNSNKMIWNDISKNMVGMDFFNNNQDKLTFKNFIRKIQTENSLFSLKDKIKP